MNNNMTTNVIAGTAVLTPWWWPLLQASSEVAALLLPIAGLVWLVVQIAGYFINHRKGNKNGLRE